MRVIRALLTSLLILAIIGGISGLIAREYYMYQAVTLVSNALTELQKAATSTGIYRKQCSQRGLPSAFEDIILQLRFTTRTQFVTEVVCGGSTLNPITLGQFTLPSFVQKRAGGSSGVIIGSPQSGVTLDIWWAQKDIVVENSQVHVMTNAGTKILDPGPLSACVGYGYQCCQSEVSEGEGETYTHVSDCPKSCYSACLPRPIVLSFLTDVSASAGRSVQVRAGEVVSFNYVVDPGSSKGATVQLEYGDGQKETTTKISGSLTHTYMCSTPGGCQYAASISARSATGAQAAATPLTQLSIQVQ